MIWGESDGIVGPEYGRALAEAIPGARFTLLPEGRPPAPARDAGRTAGRDRDLDASMTTDLPVTRIGHSCHLMEIGGRGVLTDPWFTVTPTYDPGEAVAR